MAFAGRRNPVRRPRACHRLMVLWPPGQLRYRRLMGFTAITVPAQVKRLVNVSPASGRARNRGLTERRTLATRSERWPILPGARQLVRDERENAQDRKSVFAV